MAAFAANFNLDSLSIGDGHRCALIAEVAQAHDGSLGAAHAFIDAAASAGADVIKFQTHIAAEESTAAEQFRVRFSRQDATRYEYWRRMEFSAEAWAGLVQHALEKGLIFLSSPFSFAAVDLLQRLGVPAWKVGSGEVNNLPMLSRMAATGKPVLISSGMSPLSDLDDAVGLVRRVGTPVGLFQCTTAYPCPPEQWGLNQIEALRDRYRVPVGFSDHSGDIFAPLAAVTLGARMIEVHITFSKHSFGPDTPASLSIEQLAELRRGIDQIHQAMLHPMDKDRYAEDKSELRQLFGKSVVAALDLPAGHQLDATDLALKKPGHGLPPSRFDALIGRTLRHAVVRDTFLSEADLD